MIPQIMPITDLRREARAVMESITKDGHVVYITQHGRPAVVMLDYRQYEALLAKENAQSWPDGYFESTYGATADDPLERQDQGDFPDRESLA